jgi:hypothetical protein
MVSHPPIFCDDCASLALAKLDSAPLCASCLYKALKRNAGLGIIEKIEPLEFENITMSCSIEDKRAEHKSD